MKKKLNINEISLDIANMASKAMIYEVSCFPSPGLVSPVSMGAHKDMNYYTFIDSTFAINKYFILFADEGSKDFELTEIFSNIKKIGIQAERAMFNSTNNINTHKGMIFLMGICVTAASYAIHNKKKFCEINKIIKEMCKDIIKNDFKDLNKKEELSHGEKLYITYGIEGVRGEAKKGIPLVFDYSLKVFEDNYKLSSNDRLIHTLLGIMQYCDDSTIIHRRGIEGLNYTKRVAKEIIDLGGMNTELGREAINKLNDDFIDKNISPGGSADLLGVTIFLYWVKEYMFSLY